MKYFEKRIKNFTIIQNKSKLIINYSKTAKDWFDSIIILLIGLSLFVVTYFLMSQGIKTTSYISIGGGLVFAFQAVVQSTSGIFRILQSSKKILVIDMDTKTLTSKKNFLFQKHFHWKILKPLLQVGKKKKCLQIAETR